MARVAMPAARASTAAKTYRPPSPMKASRPRRTIRPDESKETSTAEKKPDPVPRYEPHETEYSLKRRPVTLEYMLRLAFMTGILTALAYTFVTGLRFTFRPSPLPPVPPVPLTRAQALRTWFSNLVTLFVY